MPLPQAVPGDVAATLDPQEITVQDTIFVAEESVERAEEIGALSVATLLEADKSRALDVFSDADIRAVNKALKLKNGKPYVQCLATGKDRAAKPEEIVR